VVDCSPMTSTAYTSYSARGCISSFVQKYNSSHPTSPLWPTSSGTKILWLPILFEYYSNYIFKQFFTGFPRNFWTRLNIILITIHLILLWALYETFEPSAFEPAISHFDKLVNKHCNYTSFTRNSKFQRSKCKVN